MTPRSRFFAAAVCVPVAAVAAQEAGRITVGSAAPALECEDVRGERVTWDTWPDRAVVLFFHAQEMAYSQRGLSEVADALEEAADTHDRVVLLLVTASRRELESLKAGLQKRSFSSCIVDDAQRKLAGEFGVVAFPTAYCVDLDRKVAHVGKGFGPLLSARVVAGARLAAGLIDRQEFEREITSASAAPLNEDVLRINRNVRMAKQLVAAGMFEEGRQTLLKVLTPESDHLDGVALLARVLLREGRASEAQPWIDRYQKLAPGTPAVRQLRAELAIAAGDADAAQRELEGLDEDVLRVAWLKGRVLEMQGRFEAAAATYRRALESSMEKLN